MNLESDVNEADEPPRSSGRRQFLRAGIVSGVSMLTAGCPESLGGGSDDDQNTDTSTSTPTETATDTPIETPSEPETGWIIFQKPADAGDSPIYDMLEGGAIEHSVDINQALERKGNDLEEHATRLEAKNKIDKKSELTQIPENLQDSEWVKEQIQEYNQNTPFTFDGTFSWSEYEDKGSFEQRAHSSNFIRGGEGFRYVVLTNVLGNANSTHREITEALIQETEEEAGKEKNYTIGHQRADDNHGLVTLAENATYNEEEFSQQRVIVIETEAGEEIQIINLTEENLRDGKHPVYAEENLRQMYKKIMTNINDEGMAAEGLYVDNEEAQKFGEAFRNPGEYSLAYFRDKMALALDVAMDERYEGREVWVRDKGVEVV